MAEIDRLIESNFYFWVLLKKFIQNFLLIRNFQREICMNLVFQIPEILDLLLKVFQNDQEFFTKLLNQELRESIKVREWMMSRLNVTDFFEDEGSQAQDLELNLDDNGCLIEHDLQEDSDSWILDVSDSDGSESSQEDEVESEN
jgi:hypothetical protein